MSKMEKSIDGQTVMSPEISELPNDALINEKDGTARDVHDMFRMGKKQLFRRNFRFFSIFAFSMILLSSWEVTLATAAFGLGNGGTAGLIYVYIATFIGFLFIIASLAEMASMAPTAGGQYHWVSEFAPKGVQKFASYIIGWLCVLGWQAGTASGCFLAATELQGLLVLNYEDYVYERWHGTLITILIVLLLALFNTVLVKFLPLLETFALCLHVGGFFAYIIPVWIMGPNTSTSQEIWTVFTDAGGWNSNGLACLVGLITPVTAFIGSDSAAHLSEELRNASKSLPRAMLLTAVFNGSLGFITVLTFVYRIGPDIDSVLTTPTGYPFIQIYYNATGSVGGTTAMVSIMISLAIFNATANMATASRQLFAFARDNGFPFKSFFATVPQQSALLSSPVPLNAIIFTMIVSSLLSLVNIGSTIAYNQIVSLGLAALLSSYIFSIACVFLKRIRSEPLIPAHFRMGRKVGLFVNGISTGFLLLTYIFAFFPPVRNPQLATMNWAILVYGVVLIASVIYYLVIGRKIYVGPVEYVKKLT